MRDLNTAIQIVQDLGQVVVAAGRGLSHDSDADYCRSEHRRLKRPANVTRDPRPATLPTRIMMDGEWPTGRLGLGALPWVGAA